MKALRFITWAFIGAALISLGTAVTRAQDGFVRLAPEDVKFGGNPAGIQQAVLYGDPSKPGIYVIRVKFPPGVMSRPHTHNTDRMVVVIKGPWYTGTTREFDPNNTTPIPTGGYMMHPAGAVHYDGAKDQEVIVQITGMGPVTTTNVR